MTKPLCGLYAIVNELNSKFYIGSSNDLVIRWRHHRSALRGNRHDNVHLQAAWNLYGEAAFVFVPLMTCPEHDLGKIELGILEQLSPPYNMTRSVDGRYVASEQTRKKLSAASKGRTVGPETRAKQSAAQKGRPCSAEKRAKQSATMTGRRLSEDHKRKIGDGVRGREVSPETRAKLSVVNIGHKRNLGRKQSPEEKAKQSAAQIEVWKRPGMREMRSELTRVSWIKRRERRGD